MLEIYTTSSTIALWTLFVLTFLYFLENFDRYLIAVSPIPYIDYSSYEYSILAGPAFTVIYTLGGLVMALGFYEERPAGKRNVERERGSIQSQSAPLSAAAESAAAAASTSISTSTSTNTSTTAGAYNKAVITSSNLVPIEGEGETDRMMANNNSNNNNEESAIPVVEMRLGKYMVITAATFIFSSAFFCTALATNFWQQVVIRLAMGLAQSVITPFSTSIIRDHFIPSVSGAAFGIFNVGTYIAFSLSLSLGIYIYLSFGWKAGYLLFGLVGAGSALLLPILYLCCQHKSRNEYVPDYQVDTNPQQAEQQTELLRETVISTPSTPSSSHGASSYLSQEAITLSALHQIPNTTPFSGQSASFSAGINSTASSQFINSHQQAHTSGSFAQSDQYNNSRLSNVGSFHDIPREVLQQYQTTSMSHGSHQHHQNHRESFQGSLSTVDVDEDPNRPRSHKDSLLSDTDYDEDQYHDIMIRTSLLRRIKFQFMQIVGTYWWRNPGVIVLCVATGVRIGGGYIWSSYTGPFFSDLFQYDNNQDCDYSYGSVVVDMINDVKIRLSGGDTVNICDSDYPYCVDGTCAALSDNPWHNKGMDPLKLESFMSWVPLVGSALGSVLGGFLSDYIVNRHQQHDNIDSASLINTNPRAINKHSASRALIAGVSTLLSLPLVIFSFYLEFPGCFLIFIASGMVGEVYLSQTLALITDAKVVPKYLITPSVALFVLIITIIGGNSPLIIPLLKDYVGYNGQVIIDFTAASTFGSGIVGDISYEVSHSDARSLQYSMMYGLIGCYALSGMLYIVAYQMMLKNAKLR